MSAVIDREALEAALIRSDWPRGRASQLRRINGIEDYLFIRGDRMSARAAAERLGVTRRTVQRYRAVIRAVTGAIR